MSNRSHIIFHVRYLDHHKNFHITNQVSTNKTKALCRHLRSILIIWPTLNMYLSVFGLLIR